MSRYAFICLACGSDLPEPLRRAASLRCHDCREHDAPLRFEHASRERALRHRRALLDTLLSDDFSLEPTAA
jgi:hypothetical protein